MSIEDGNSGSSVGNTWTEGEFTVDDWDVSIAGGVEKTTEGSLDANEWECNDDGGRLDFFEHDNLESKLKRFL